jgi:hypothetical protein
MIQEEFYAVVKLVSGEEIFGKVSPTEEQGEEYLILLDPIIIIIEELNNVYFYRIEPWLKLTEETIFFLEKSKIITIVESFDEELIKIYKRYLNKSDFGGTYVLNRSEGFIDNVKRARMILEKIYRIN